MCNNSNVVFHLQLAKTRTSQKNQILYRDSVQSRVIYGGKGASKRGAQPSLGVKSGFAHITSPRVMGCVWINCSSLHSSEGSVGIGPHVQCELNITMTNLLCMVNSPCFFKLSVFLLYYKCGGLCKLVPLANRHYLKDSFKETSFSPVFS